MEYNIIYYCIEKVNYAEGDPDMDPHLRRLLLQHLQKFLETKGYGVDPVIASEHEPEYYERRSTEAATVAIDKINAKTVFKWGKRYELVSRDKAVWAHANRTVLLTLKVKELDADYEVVMVGADADADAAPVEVLKTIRVMVYASTQQTQAQRVEL